MDDLQIKYFLEAALLAAGRPLSIDQMQGLFDGRSVPEKSRIRKAIQDRNDDYEERGVVVSEPILDGPRSIVIHEARNRMLAQMAVLHQMLGGAS